MDVKSDFLAQKGVQADQRARGAGCEMVLRPGDESIQRVFELTGALDVLRVEPADAGAACLRINPPANPRIAPITTATMPQPIE